MGRRSQAATTAELLRHADDNLLVSQAKGGERAAFEELVRRYERRIFALTYRMMGNPDDALELTQESFLRAYTNLSRTKDELNFSAWLHRIASNACLDALRRRTHFRWLPWNGTIHDQLLLQHPEDDPERVAIAVENTLNVQHTLNRMSPHHRLALVLREHEGLSTQEIGEVMRLTRPAVKSVLFRARNEFRTLYQAECDDLSRI